MYLPPVCVIVLGFPYVIPYACVSTRMLIPDPSIIEVAHSLFEHICGVCEEWAWGLGKMEACFMCFLVSFS